MVKQPCALPQAKTREPMRTRRARVSPPCLTADILETWANAEPSPVRADHPAGGHLMGIPLAGREAVGPCDRLPHRKLESDHDRPGPRTGDLLVVGRSRRLGGSAAYTRLHLRRECPPRECGRTEAGAFSPHASGSTSHPLTSSEHQP